MKRKKRLRAILTLQNGIALTVFLGCVGIGWWLFIHLNLQQLTPMSLLHSINGMGWTGVGIFIGITALAIVISPIPGTPMTVAAGAVWGSIPAAIYTIIGVFAGSLLAYFIGRILGRSAVKVLTGKMIYLSKDRGEIYLGWITFVSHLVPILPFDLMSYGAGISGLSLPIYASATLLGTIPGTFFLTYLGSHLRVGLGLGLGLLLVSLLFVVILARSIYRHNWLGLREIVRLE